MGLRELGTFPVAANYEPRVGAPFDARQLVQTKAALTDAATWLQSDGGMYIYNSMIVAVGNDPIVENNGLYLLQDKTFYSLDSGWIKLANIEQIKFLQEQLSNLEAFGIGNPDIIVESFDKLPITGDESMVYYVKNNNLIYRYDSKKEEYIPYKNFNIVQAAQIADYTIKASHLKASANYTGNDAEIWIFNCGSSTVNI